MENACEEEDESEDYYDEKYTWADSRVEIPGWRREKDEWRRNRGYGGLLFHLLLFFLGLRGEDEERLKLFRVFGSIPCVF